MPTLYIRLAIAAVLLAAGFAAAWVVQSWRYGSQITEVRLAHAKTLIDIADKTAKAQKAVNAYSTAVQREMGAKDAEHYKELTDARTETNRLRACVRAGTCGVRFITTTNHAACDVPGDAGAGSVGDGAIEIGGADAERVLDLSESIHADRAKLDYLRDYAQACWRAGFAAQALTD